MRRRFVARLSIALAMWAAGCDSLNLTGEMYTSDQGRYRVWFPRKPQLTVKVVPTVAGTMTFFIALSEESSRTIVRLATYGDFPALVFMSQTRDQVLDRYCEGWAKGSNSTIRNQGVISIDGHPGREFDFDSSNGKGEGKSRVYLVGHRLYHVMAAVENRTKGTSDGMFRSFLDSFKLMEGTPPPMGPELVAGPPPVAPSRPEFGPQGIPGPMGPQGINPGRPPGMGNPQGPGMHRPGMPGGPRGFPGMAGRPNDPNAPGAPAGPQWPGRGPRRMPRFGPTPPQGAQPAPMPVPVPNPNAAPAPTPAPEPAPQPEPTPQPAPEPERGTAQRLAFYDIPEPATAEIEPGSSDRDATEAIGEAALRAFNWMDEDSDRIGGADADSKSDGTKDQHFRLELDLPPTAVVLSMTITGGESHRWSTRPGDPGGPIAIDHGGRSVTRSYVDPLGVFPGRDPFDLYVDGGSDGGRSGAFDIEVILRIGSRRKLLTGHCERPARAAPAGPLADAGLSKPAGEPPSPLLIPVRPGAPAPGEHRETRPRPAPAPTAVPRPLPGDHAATEIPTMLTPTGGGALIRAFNWIGRDDDYVAADGRRIGPGGGKDEHFRLDIELPAAAVVEEIAILGGEVRWTTRPLPRSWPLAVVANQVLKNHRQSYRLGPYSGRWTFDLYAEPQGEAVPGQAFGVEVVVFVGGSRHRLTARCQRP